MNSFLSRFLSGFVSRGFAVLVRRAGVALAAVVVIVVAGLSLFDAPVSAGNDSGSAFTLKGRVVHVSDGDTFNLLVNGKEQRIRMASIDAPEVGKGSQQPGQPYGQASRQALSDLIAGKNLVLQCFERDRYRRAICDAVLPEGNTTANRQQVLNGMAWANMEKRGQFLRDPGMPQLQEQAKAQRRGLWRDPDPVQPWKWRYQCWRQGVC